MLEQAGNPPEGRQQIRREFPVLEQVGDVNLRTNGNAAPAGWKKSASPEYLAPAADGEEPRGAAFEWERTTFLQLAVSACFADSCGRALTIHFSDGIRDGSG